MVVFENRSFDNLLGPLYEPGEVASFEGVIGKRLSNRVPEWAEHRPQDGIVCYGVAANMNPPNPDSGEELPHVNTQLFGLLDQENRFSLAPLVAPLGLLGKSLLLAVLAFAKASARRSPTSSPKTRSPAHTPLPSTTRSSATPCNERLKRRRSPM